MALLALPRFVAIQSKIQTYLRYMHKDVGLHSFHGFLEFSGEEIVSPYAKFEIEGAKSTTAAGNENGFVHIRCCYNNKYLVAKSSSDDFIIAWADEPNEDQSQSSCTLFEPIPVSGEGHSSTKATVRFRHVQLGHYLTGDSCLLAQSSSTDSDRRDVFGIIDWGSLLIKEGKDNCLYAGVDTLSKEARLVVEELVISREIYNVKFHLMDARIYNKNLITMVTKSATNHTQVPDTAKLKFLYKETKSSTWNTSVSLKLGTKTNITAGIPFIVDGKIEISAEFSGGYQWGETMSTENQVDTEYTFPVPPMSKVTVSLLATQGSCDVPYSYTQRDTLMNGEQVIHNFDDGVYTGINSFNFFYQPKQEKL